MGSPKLTIICFLTLAIAFDLIPTKTTALMPYTRTPLWDLLLSPDDPFRVLEQTPLPLPRGGGEPLALARSDWKETPTEHVVTLDVPGLRKEDVKIEVDDENRVLRISGERKMEAEEKGDKWHRTERVIGKFWREFRLPRNADLEGIKARLENGVLRINVPKLAEEKKRGSKVVCIDEVEDGSADDEIRAANKAEM